MFHVREHSDVTMEQPMDLHMNDHFLGDFFVHAFQQSTFWRSTTGYYGTDVFVVTQPTAFAPSFTAFKIKGAGVEKWQFHTNMLKSYKYTHTKLVWTSQQYYLVMTSSDLTRISRSSHIQQNCSDFSETDGGSCCFSNLMLTPLVGYHL